MRGDPPPPGDGLVGREVRKQFVNEQGESEWFGGIILSYDRLTKYAAAAAQPPRGCTARSHRCAPRRRPQPAPSVRAACATSASACGADTRIVRVRFRWYKIQYEDGDTEECTRADTVACLTYSSSWTPGALPVRGARARAAARTASAAQGLRPLGGKYLTDEACDARSRRWRHRSSLRPRRASRPVLPPRRR